MGRDKRIYEEAAALWRSLYGEPPPREADGAMILDLIVKKTPDAGYGRLASPHLRASNITFPKPATN
jgi:hypothetical protein